MIDWSRIRELRRDIGAENFIEIVELFLQEAEDLLQQLARTRDRAAHRNVLHCLRGSALAMGFDDLVGLCAEHENMGRAGLPDVAGLRAAFEQGRDVLLAGLDTLAAPAGH